MPSGRRRFYWTMVSPIPWHQPALRVLSYRPFVSDSVTKTIDITCNERELERRDRKHDVCVRRRDCLLQRRSLGGRRYRRILRVADPRHAASCSAVNEVNWVIASLVEPNSVAPLFLLCLRSPAVDIKVSTTPSSNRLVSAPGLILLSRRNDLL
jgi:hypothetical protein